MPAHFDGARARHYRLASGHRPEQVAVAAGRSLETIHRYERGHSDPPASVVAKLAELYGVPVGALFTGTRSDAAVPAP